MNNKMTIINAVPDIASDILHTSFSRDQANLLKRIIDARVEPKTDDQLLTEKVAAMVKEEIAKQMKTGGAFNTSKWDA